jgi:hypothetical protein
MRYKGYEYSVVQTANPTGWKWTVQLDETRVKVGSAFSRASAILFAQRRIEKEAKLKTAARSGASRGQSAAGGS